MVGPSRLVLLGHPVAHSLSPAMQTAALQAAGIAATYEALAVAPDDLPDAIDLLREERTAGNVTVPHKERMAALCDMLTPLAMSVEAVNTFWFEPDGRLVGDNTDVGGFDFAARFLLQDAVERARVLILGAGGSAAAVLEAVSEWPRARVTLAARTRARAEELAERYADFCDVVDFTPELGTPVGGNILAGSTLIVNATPLGLDGMAMPIDAALVPSSCAVMDLTYRRGRTPWVNALRTRGIRAEDGLPMLVEQGALAFERWYGVPADRVAMLRAIR
jgi:shikimate dehydrogenase